MAFNNSRCCELRIKLSDRERKQMFEEVVNEKIVLESSFSEINQLCTKTSKTTEESHEGQDEALLDSELPNNSKIWNQNDIIKLFTQYKEYGSRWTIIAKMLNGKHENSLKNKFNCSIRKFTRRLNKINKEVHIEFRKEIRTESIFRILEATQLFPNMEDEMKKKSLNIRSMILFEAQKEEEAECSQNIIDLIDDINNFNLKTRSHKNPKHKRRKDIILFEPAKEFSNCGIEENAINVKYCVEAVNVKGNDHNCNVQIIPLEDRQSSSIFPSTLLNETEILDNNLAIPLPYQAEDPQNNSCCWKNVFNSEEFHVCDAEEWFHHEN